MPLLLPWAPVSPWNHPVFYMCFLSCVGFHSLPIWFIRLVDFFPPPPKTTHTLRDSFIAFIPRSCIRLFLLSVHLWPTHSFDSNGACPFFCDECVSLLWQHLFGRISPAKTLNLRLAFCFHWFVCVLRHVSVYIKAAILIKKQLTSPYRWQQCPNCWRLHFFPLW